MNIQPVISPSPHFHSGNSIGREMYNVLFALIPALLTATYFFGLRALATTLLCMVCCAAIEAAVQRFILKQPIQIKDGSALLTGLLLSLNLPPTLPLWIAIIGCIAAMCIGKLPYGGIGNNIFNPALVGRIFLLIAYPAQMTTWALPQPLSLWIDGETGATILSIAKEQGVASILVTPCDLLFGNRGGSAGETGALALLLGGAFLLYRRTITWHIPVAVIVSAALLSEILFLIDPTTYLPPAIHLISGGLLLGAIFMATDYVTSPMSHRGMLLYGAGIGTLTILIRSFGSYPEGVSFAILIMNAFTPLINTYIKPRRFSPQKKH